MIESGTMKSSKETVEKKHCYFERSKGKNGTLEFRDEKQNWKQCVESNVVCLFTYLFLYLYLYGVLLKYVQSWVV